MIYLFENITPNHANNLHYYFKSELQYVQALGTPYMTFEEDNYLLNGNTLSIRLPYSTDTEEVSYIAWNNGGVWRFYHVTDAFYQSGYTIFELRLDIWATYIHEANISRIHVNRSNKLVGVGLYDNIPITHTRSFARLGEEFEATDLAIVYVVAFATGVSSILVNNAGTYLGVYAQEIEEDEDKPEGMPLLDWWLSLVSGIHSVASTLATLDANVLKAYIVPKNYLAIKSGTVPIFNTKTTSFNGTLTPTFEVAPFVFPVIFSFDIDPNFKYYVGTKYAGLEVARLAGESVSVIYNFMVKQDGLQVLIQHGDKMLDITSAFQVGLTSNDGNFTTSQQIAATLRTLGSVSANVGAIAAGGAGAEMGALNITSAMAGLFKEGNARYTQGGDGLSTYRAIDGSVMSPFYMQMNESIIDETEKIRFYGIAFDEFLTDINVVFDAPYVVTDSESYDTFVAADTRVTGVPSTACDYIANTFNRGVYITRI